MSYTKLVNGEIVPMSPQEIADRQDEEARFLEEAPLKKWEAKIAATDSKLPRVVEDIIDALDAPTKAKISRETLDLYEAKKTIRAQKPKER